MRWPFVLKSTHQNWMRIRQVNVEHLEAVIERQHRTISHRNVQIEALRNELASYKGKDDHELL